MADKQLLEISELFFSIQGESSYAGYPCVFIRLAGCNLRCVFCDAKYTYEEKGRRLPLDEIITYTRKFPEAIIEITGGEPLLQENVYPLMESLLSEKRVVLLETNGSIDLSRVPEKITTIMDIKCPGSGMSENIHFNNMEILRPHDEIKFVLSGREDYDWAKALIKRHRLGTVDHPQGLHFSPVAGRLSGKTLAAWIL